MRSREDIHLLLAQKAKPLFKICGLMEERDASFAQDADVAGFVFAPSRRKVSAQKAKRIGTFLPKDVLKAGVFVDDEPKDVKRIMEEAGLDIAQLHGEETDQDIRALQEEGIFVIKAFRVKEAFDQIRDLVQESPADLVLLDAPSPGSGKTFSWENLSLERDFLLAGGLCAQNLRKAEKLKPYGFDLSSGAERDGKKDREKIKEIITIAESIKRERTHA